MPDDGSGSDPLDVPPDNRDRLALERRLLFWDELEASSISLELERVHESNRPSERESVFLRSESSSSRLGRALTTVGRCVDSGRVIVAPLHQRHRADGYLAERRAAQRRAPAALIAVWSHRWLRRCGSGPRPCSISWSTTPTRGKNMCPPLRTPAIRMPIN
jgi:hypothetical protein